MFVYDADLGWDAATVFESLGEAVTRCSDLDSLVAEIATMAMPGDSVVVMSNGGFGGIQTKLLEALAD